MTRLTSSERAAHIKIIKEVFGAVLKVHELPDGYAFGLPFDDQIWLKAAEFVTKERLCCPFFSFELEADSGEVFWLSIEGTEGVKPFIMAEIGRALNKPVTKNAGFIE